MLPPVLRDRLRLPVIGAPLFIVSNPDLVIAQCKAGVVGSFPSLNARPDRPARRMAASHHRGARRLGPRQSANAAPRLSPSTRSSTRPTIVSRRTSRSA